MPSNTLTAVMRRRLQAFAQWLQNVPIENPVDRRNAPMVQILLLLMCAGVPVMSLPRWLAIVHGTPIDYMVELIDGATIFMVYFNLWLIRQGHFKLAVELFISTSLCLMAVSYWHTGLDQEIEAQVTQAFPLVLGGLLLGRRALWLIALATIGIFGMGTAIDIHRGTGQAGPHVVAFIRSSIGFVVIAIILDRAVSSLRETLDLVQRRGAELERIQHELRQEIIEKERSQAMLMQSQKIEAIGRVSSGLAHDFNNILGVIMGYASKPDAFERYEAAIDALDGIKLAAQRGAIAVKRLLGLGRNQHSAPEPFDIGCALQDMKPMIQQVFGHRIMFAMHLPEQTLGVYLDRADFELAVLNIVGNARDAMPHGGNFVISATQAKGQVTLTFSDDGVGMSRAVLEHLFEPFFTTKSIGLGSGMGLAVVKRFVDEAHGQIDVESTEGAGTTLRISLPQASGPAIRAGVPSIDAPRGDASGDASPMS